MQANRAAALATVSKDGIPHVAIVYCATYEDLSAYFMTRVESRKFTNLRHQPKVALAFTDEPRLQTVQLTGVSERVEDFKQEHAIWHELIRLRIPSISRKPVPAIQIFEAGGTNELAIIKVTPTELTFASFDIQPDGRYKTFFEKIL